MRLKPHKNNKGFTIIELLVATAVFSVVLLVILTAFIQISRLFYKGVSMNNTQETTRNITQSLIDDIKFTQSAPPSFTATVGSPGAGQFCIGLHRYRYQMGHQLGSAPGDYSVTRDTINTASGCPSIIQVPVDPNTSDELLDNGMQLNEIAINCSGGRCLVNVHVIFYGGDHDVFATNIAGYGGNPWLAPDAECTGSLLSTQFCAVADYNRTVTQG